MRLAFVVNHALSEHPHTTTTLLARTALARGHRVHWLDVADLTLFANGRVGGQAARLPERSYATGEELVDAIRRGEVRERVDSADLDVLWLRYNPSELGEGERWATYAGMLFGRLAAEQGVLVLDDPEALLWAEGKMYLQHFPPEARPRTLITRSLDDIRRFRAEVGGRTVLKPLDGYGGADVFLVDESGTNLPTIVETLRRRGYIVAQEFLSGAEHGDLRLFLMNGRPLRVDGRYAAIRRVCAEGDFRSNMTAGGRAEPAEVDERALSVARLVAPRVVADGIFLCGLDIVGDRLLEINTISPGGLWSASRLQGADFGAAIMRAVERKLELRTAHPDWSNRRLASAE